MTREWPQETIARTLVDHLTRLLGELVELSVKGAGVHWTVSAQSGVRTCHIDCFHYETGSNALLPPGARSGAEYLMNFLDDRVSAADGRWCEIEAGKANEASAVLFELRRQLACAAVRAQRSPSARATVETRRGRSSTTAAAPARVQARSDSTRAF
jgi:hypothetical protein